MLERSKQLQDLTFRFDDAISRQKETAMVNDQEILLSALAFKISEINSEFGRGDLAQAYLKESLRFQKIELKNAEERDRLKFLLLCEKIKEKLNEYIERGPAALTGEFFLRRSINPRRQEQVDLILKTIEELKSQADHKKASSVLQNLLLSVREQIDSEYRLTWLRNRSVLSHLIEQILDGNSEQNTDALKLGIK